MLGSCSDLRRAASTADPGFVFVILQSDAHALGLAEGCAATTIRPTIWDHYGHTNLIRIASSLRADMIFGKDMPRHQPRRSCRIPRGYTLRQKFFDVIHRAA